MFEALHFREQLDNDSTYNGNCFGAPYQLFVMVYHYGNESMPYESFYFHQLL